MRQAASGVGAKGRGTAYVAKGRSDAETVAGDCLLSLRYCALPAHRKRRSTGPGRLKSDQFHVRLRLAVPQDEPQARPRSALHAHECSQQLLAASSCRRARRRAVCVTAGDAGAPAAVWKAPRRRPLADTTTGALSAAERTCLTCATASDTAPARQAEGSPRCSAAAHSGASPLRRRAPQVGCHHLLRLPAPLPATGV